MITFKKESLCVGCETCVGCGRKNDFYDVDKLFCDSCDKEVRNLYSNGDQQLCAYCLLEERRIDLDSYCQELYEKNLEGEDE